MSFAPEPLVHFLEKIEDPRRQASCTYKLVDVLFIAICAMLSGAETWEDMQLFAEEKADWLSQLLFLPNKKVPSHDTFYRVFSLICPEQFQVCFTQWVTSVFSDILCSFDDKDSSVIAIDGKMIKGSSGKHTDPVCMVSAWSAHLRLVLTQKKVADKSNEITAVPVLLKNLALKGCLVTADAMHCQKKVAQTCIDAGADYLLAVKGNQKKLHKDIQAHIERHWEKASEENTASSFYEKTERGHGREEYRACWVFNEADELSTHMQWPGIKQFGVVQADRTINGKASTSLRFYICSREMNAEQMLKATRNHWGIENNLHWQLDVSFNEDGCQTKNDIAAENLSTLRRMCLNILKTEKSKGSLKGKRKRAGWSNDFLRNLLSIFWKSARA